MKTYAGVGNRKSPADALRLMERVARRLALLGWTLRTGGAEGADRAFERGAREGGGAVELYLPWPGYNGYREGRLQSPSPAAMQMAGELHPAWKQLPLSVKKLMARNSHQVLGADLTNPAAFVLCWTEDGAESEEQCGPSTGGTGQTIRLASRLGIPVINLRQQGALERIARILQ